MVFVIFKSNNLLRFHIHFLFRSCWHCLALVNRRLNLSLSSIVIITRRVVTLCVVATLVTSIVLRRILIATTVVLSLIVLTIWWWVISSVVCGRWCIDLSRYLTINRWWGSPILAVSRWVWALSVRRLLTEGRSWSYFLVRLVRALGSNLALLLHLEHLLLLEEELLSHFRLLILRCHSHIATSYSKLLPLRRILHTYIFRHLFTSRSNKFLLRVLLLLLLLLVLVLLLGLLKSHLGLSLGDWLVNHSRVSWSVVLENTTQGVHIILSVLSILVGSDDWVWRFVSVKES